MDKKALFYLSDSQTELITAVFYRSIDGILTYTLYARGSETVARLLYIVET